MNDTQKSAGPAGLSVDEIERQIRAHAEAQAEAREEEAIERAVRDLWCRAYLVGLEAHATDALGGARGLAERRAHARAIAAGAVEDFEAFVAGEDDDGPEDDDDGEDAA